MRLLINLAILTPAVLVEEDVAYLKITFFLILIYRYRIIQPDNWMQVKLQKQLVSLHIIELVIKARSHTSFITFIQAIVKP